jgi:site-specific DNA-cytosine methylase
MKYIELCAGIGGARIGLDNAGWECVLAIDLDPEAVEIHKAAFGECIQADVTKFPIKDVPEHDVLVAGFPCQPFSSSGNRQGFNHRSGNVFSAIARIIESRIPKYCIFENVQGLLSNSYGHSFATILSEMNRLGYVVEWLVINASWFGAVQNRPRVFAVAYRYPIVPNANDLVGRIDTDAIVESESIFERIPQLVDLKFVTPTSGELARVLEERRPRVGLRRPKPTTPFQTSGISRNGEFNCLKVRKSTPDPIDGSRLGMICCPEFEHRQDVRSVRYWGHTGDTTYYFKKEPISHCIGTNIGANPTFGISNSKIRSKAARNRVLQFANWSRQEEDVLVFRLNPERSVLLFGESSICLQEAFRKCDVCDTSLYRLLGNMVVPETIESIARAIESYKSDECTPKKRKKYRNT